MPACSVTHFLLDFVHGLLEEHALFGPRAAAQCAKICECHQDRRQGEGEAQKPETNQHSRSDRGRQEELAPYDHQDGDPQTNDTRPPASYISRVHANTLARSGRPGHHGLDVG